mgnify:CR=1 FL=1
MAALPFNVQTQKEALGVDEETANLSATFGTSIGQNGCAGIYPAMLAVMADVDFGAEGSAKWEAELKYLRGFLYADMAFLYGGMPLITESITSEEADALARSSQAQTYEQAISDLTFAAANLGDTPNAGEFGRPTKMDRRKIDKLMGRN